MSFPERRSGKHGRLQIKRISKLSFRTTNVPYPSTTVLADKVKWDGRMLITLIVRDVPKGSAQGSSGV
jgi:hypothetical protein